MAQNPKPQGALAQRLPRPGDALLREPSAISHGWVPNPNVQTRFYVGGHMTYLDDGARVLEKADLVRFYQGGL